MSVGGISAGGAEVGVSVAVGPSLPDVESDLTAGAVGSAVPGSSAGGVTCGSLSREPSTVGSSEIEDASSGVARPIEPRNNL